MKNPQLPKWRKGKRTVIRYMDTLKALYAEPARRPDSEKQIDMLGFDGFDATPDRGTGADRRGHLDG